MAAAVYLGTRDPTHGVDLSCDAAKDRAAVLDQNLDFENGDLDSAYITPPLTQGAGEEASYAIDEGPDDNTSRVMGMVMPPSLGADADVPSRVQFHPEDEPTWRSGDEAWYSVSMFLGEDWDLTQIEETREAFAALFSFRWRDIDEENGPGTGIVMESMDGIPHFVANRETNGWSYPDDAGRDQIDLGPVETGRWIDFVVHVKWSASPRDALREYWRDGKLMGRSTNQNMGTDEVIFHRMGLYQGTDIDHERTLYWDNHRIGGSFEAVNPACPT